MAEEHSTPIPENLSDVKRRLFELLLKEKRGAKVAARQDLVTGDVAITPPQAHEFEIPNPDRHMFNLPLLLEVHVPLSVALLEQIVMALIHHHDALRLCSIHDGQGWRQFIAPPPATAPVSYVNLTSLPDAAAQRRAVEAQVAELQQSFDLATGPLFKAAYFDLGPDQPARLLLLAHHIACDHHSSSILAEDFMTAYAQFSSGQPIALPAKTVSYLDWSHRLARHARSQTIRQELPYWLDRDWHDLRRLPLDDPSGANIGHEWRVHSHTIDLSVYPYLAHQHLKPYNLQIQHVLMTSIARALIAWTGGSKALISMCQHGRMHPFKELDISRTVGWFSYQYPLLIDLTDISDEMDQLQRTRAQIESVPHQGLNYGVLRYMAEPAVVEQIKAVPEPDLFLNIRVGTHMQIPGFKPAREHCGDGSSPTILRTRHLYLNINQNEPQLTFDCLYNPNTQRASSIEHFIQSVITQLQAINDALAVRQDRA